MKVQLIAALIAFSLLFGTKAYSAEQSRDHLLLLFEAKSAHLIQTLKSPERIEDSGLKRVGRCLNAPLPLDPTGQVNSVDFNVLSGRIRVQAWRRSCGDGTTVALLTITPLSGSPFVCPPNYAILQGNRQFSWEEGTLYTDPQDLITPSFCGTLLLTTTFAIQPLGLLCCETPYDYDSSFVLSWDSGTAGGGRTDVVVPGVGGGGNPGPGTDDDLGPENGGLFYNPSQDGHGLDVLIYESGDAIVFWYTYDPDGNPIFIIAQGAVNGLRVEAMASIFTGMEFGSFNPNDNRQNNWGTITLTFEGCDALTLDYSSSLRYRGSLFGSGTISMVRLAAVPGNACGP